MIKNNALFYHTHIQTYGWEGATDDIYYRVHAQSFGWLDWAKNGEPSGTAGYSKRLEGIQIVLVPKGGNPPAEAYAGITADITESYIEQ